jgi:hypothetical protein
MPLHASASLAAQSADRNLMGVGSGPNLRQMNKVNFDLSNIARLIQSAIRRIARKHTAAGPVAIWDGEPKRASADHDSVHDEP